MPPSRRHGPPDEATNALKFGFPFAHTFTLLAWTLQVYEEALKGIANLDEARFWVKVGANYTMQAHVSPYKFIGQMAVGEGVDFRWLVLGRIMAAEPDLTCFQLHRRFFQAFSLIFF